MYIHTNILNVNRNVQLIRNKKYDKSLGRTLPKIEDWWVSFIKILPNLEIAILVLVLTVFLSFRLKKIAVKL